MAGGCKNKPCAVAAGFCQVGLVHQEGSSEELSNQREVSMGALGGHPAATQQVERMSILMSRAMQ